jgi:hypothetical protein
MDLKDYLYFSRKTIVNFAKEVGVSRHHMSRIVNKRDKPSRLLARYIEEITGGEVTIKDLME